MAGVMIGAHMACCYLLTIAEKFLMKMKSRTLLLATLVCASLVGCESEVQQQVEVVESTDMCFGIYNADELKKEMEKYVSIKNYLQDTLKTAGMPVEVQPKIYVTYEGAIDGLAKGECDLFRLGPASYILAKKKNEDIRVLAMEHKNNKRIFSGVFIVAKDSPIENVSEIAGKTFAFGDMNSTIGRYLSQARLINSGIHSSDLKRYEFLNRHDKVAKAVIAGEFEVGVVKESTFKKNADNLKMIGEFPNIAKPWVVRAGLDEGLFNALQAAFLALDDQKVLKTIKKSGFLAATDQDYDFVRENMELATQF